MRRKKTLVRLARKEGWYDGHRRQQTPTPWPYDDINLCLEYEDAYWEGRCAKDDARNPYGNYKTQ